MRTILIAALFACTLLTPAQAQERLSSTRMQDYVGQYELTDGRVLNVNQRGRALVAQVEGQEAVELKPTGPSGFAARSGGLRIAFEQHSNGNVTGVTVTGADEGGRQAGR